MSSNLSQRIILARETRGWNQKTLASILISYGIMTQQSLSLLEQGKTLKTSRIIDLAWVLGVNPIWLATGDGDMDAATDHPIHQASDKIAALVAKLDAMDRSGKLTPEMIEAISATLSAFDSAGLPAKDATGEIR